MACFEADSVVRMILLLLLSCFKLIANYHDYRIIIIIKISCLVVGHHHYTTWEYCDRRKVDVSLYFGLVAVPTTAGVLSCILKLMVKYLVSAGLLVTCYNAMFVKPEN